MLDWRLASTLASKAPAPVRPMAAREAEALNATVASPEELRPLLIRPRLANKPRLVNKSRLVNKPRPRVWLNRGPGTAAVAARAAAGAGGACAEVAAAEEEEEEEEDADVVWQAGAGAGPQKDSTE
mmetsp:Transcript_23945/g.54027  ORF Transcript_23945/g.54027 Transcript_23945/m.54027 type:complete len:126 (+) Transcript_23945:1067-1444(+)